MIDDEDAYYWNNILEYMTEQYKDTELITTVDELHEGVLYWMDKKDIEKLQEDARRGVPEADKRMEAYYTDMRRLEIALRLDYEDNKGKIEETEEFITALENKDDATLKTIIYKYTEDLRNRRLAWRDGKIDEDRRKKEEFRKEIQREEDKKQKKRDQEREQQAAAAAASSPSTTSKLPFQPTVIQREPARPVRAPPTPQRELDETKKKEHTIPKTPSLAAISPRLRLDSKNFKNDETVRPDSHYEKILVYEGFEQGNYLDKYIPKVLPDEECNATTALQKLLSLSLHYAPTFFSTLTKQKMQDKRDLGWPEEQVQVHEQVLRDTQVLELYMVLSQKAIDMWITCGSVPASYIDKSYRRKTWLLQLPHGSTIRHYRLHQLVRLQLPRGLCAGISTVHNTEVLMTELLLRGSTYDRQVARTDDERHESTYRTRPMWMYFELKAVYKQKHRRIVEDKRGYKQNHYHDYSIITTNLGLDVDYIRKIIIETYQQAEEKKDENNPPHSRKLLIFII
eukprot:6490704-Amphidinium_carterae.2